MDGKKSYRGSFFNEQYFSDCSRRVTLDEDHIQHSEFVYQGLYYVFQAGGKAWTRRKWTVFAAIFLGCAVHIAAMCLEVSWMDRKGMVGIQVALFLFLLLLLLCGFWRLGTKERMPVWPYRMAVVSVKEAALVCCLLSILLLLAEGLACFQSKSRENILAWLTTLLVCALMAWIFSTVSSEKFTQEESQDRPHGLDITDCFPDGE